jgi:hypothetical protein
MRKSLETELAAARTVAARVGLGETQPQILKLAHHTTVRLSPAAVVARIQSAGNFDSDQSSPARELTVASYLASRGAPTVRPASNVDAGPHLENGCTITLWDFVVGRSANTDADALIGARALHLVHEALNGIPSELPSFTVAFDSCERILFSQTEARMLNSSDRAFLQALYAELRQKLSHRELDCRPLHGDAHLGNVLITASGAIWMDLDDVCSGPLEWDVATLPSRAWSEFDGIDRDLTRLLADLRSLCVSVWCWADFERNAEVREAANHHLEELKARFSQRARLV